MTAETTEPTAMPVRSYKRRSGRITAGQRAALESLVGRYAVDAPSTDPIDPAALFGRTAPLVLEIGFGMGEATLTMAADDPGRDVLAVDVHRPGAGALVRDVHRFGLPNVRVLVGDAVDVLRDRLAPGSLDEVRLYFPDPWPKARHHKRRLFTPAFARLVATRLRPGGRLHLATDWTPYAEQMRAVLDAEPLFTLDPDGDPAGAADGVPDAGPGGPRPVWRPVTRFERQGLARGHQVHDLLARTVTRAESSRGPRRPPGSRSGAPA
jgi:tRNA (guanine-N7-)-methyltransferase